MVAGAAAAAKAVEVVTAKVLSEDEETKNQLVKLAEETPEMKAAARTYAARVAVKQQIKLRFIRPLAYVFGVSREYFEDRFLEEMAAKTANIPAENSVSPSPSVAVPAMQGLGYSLDEPALKEMYLNLLAAASDGRRADEAHPAFAEIIKQLNSQEAVSLNRVLQSESIPIADLKERVDIDGRSGYLLRCRNLAPTLVAKQDSAIMLVSSNPSWIDNWERLGLVTVSYGEFINTDSAYDWLPKHPEYVRLKEDASVGPIEIGKGLLRRTDFGKLFFSAVSPAISS